MEKASIYNGTITAEQFLFYEIRIASKYYLGGTPVDDAIEEIKANNLFQYPTERLVARMVRSCYKRLDALDDEQLRQELSSAPAEIAKQINGTCRRCRRASSGSSATATTRRGNWKATREA